MEWEMELDLSTDEAGQAWVHQDSGMPNFGKLDQMLSTYSTPKLVEVKDRRLANIHRICEIIILAYILVYACLYQCHHLRSVPVSGTARITIQQPTDDCNPMDISCNSNFRARNQLPYCMHNAQGPPNATDAMNCTYADGIDLTEDYPIPGAFFVFSRITKFVQTRECDPDATADWGCNTTLYRTEVQYSDFVADLESFTLLLGHSFLAEDGHGNSVHGDSTDVDGYVYTPSGPQPIPEVHTSDFAYPSMRRLLNRLGDVISVADLIKGCDGEPRLDSIPDPERNLTLRWQGGIVHVTMYYTNKEAWGFRGGSRMAYAMKSRLQPVSEFKQMYGIESEDLVHRTVMNAHGFLITVSVSGDYYCFEWVYLIQMLAGSFAMFVLARMVADFCMAYLMGADSVKYGFLLWQPLHHTQRQASIDMDEEDAHHDTIVEGHVKEIYQRLRAKEAPRSHDELVLLMSHLDYRLNHLDAHHTKDFVDKATFRARLKKQRTIADRLGSLNLPIANLRGAKAEDRDDVRILIPQRSHRD